jgi:WD40 repeat protein
VVARMRGLRLVHMLSAALVVLGSLTGFAINAATSERNRWPWGLELIRVHPFGWSVGFTALVVIVGSSVSRLQRVSQRREMATVPAVERPEPWVVDRPTEVKRVVTALRRRKGSTVAVTTALHGAGGFGKTTVAKMIRSDPRVLRRFDGRVYWVTLGRDLHSKGAIVSKVNDVIKRVASDKAIPPFTDPQQAGEYLGALFDDGRRRLIVLDDVWYPEQLAPFAVGAERCSRLVTTRNQSLLSGDGVAIEVDQMSHEQARELLTWNLPALPNALVDTLLAETGRWPLLLRLVNKVLADQAKTSTNLTRAAEDVRDRLKTYGALAIDELTGEASRPLDVNDPDKRQRAVRATIEASTDLLSAKERMRLAELAIFAENEIVPVTLVSRLWRATAGLDLLSTRAICARLSDLALVSSSAPDGGAIGIHAVVRDYFLDQFSRVEVEALHTVLVDVVAADLPTEADQRQVSAPAATSWWRLDPQARYLWEHLAEHLVAARREAEAEKLSSDLRWVAARLVNFGPAAPYADLALLSTTRASRLRATFAQAAHLLGPTDPPYAQIDILHSRVDHDPDWGPQIASIQGELQRPRLVNLWQLPDLPDPAMRRTIPTLHRGGVSALAVAASRSWLASGGADGSVRIWDVHSGHQRADLKAHRGGVYALAVAPDSNWLGTGSGDGSITVWDANSWHHRARFKGHRGGVYALAVAPDGSWLASGGIDGSITIWDADSWQRRIRFRAHRGGIYALAVALDGGWLASAGADGSVLVWDPENGELRAPMRGQGHAITVALSPTSSGLASCDWTGSVSTWNVATGQQRTQPARLGVAIRAATFDRDCTWMAFGGVDGAVSVWNVATGQQHIRLSGHQGAVSAVAVASDGTWLCSGGVDGLLRIWDYKPTNRPPTTTPMTGHANAVSAVAVAPDGHWLASGGANGSIEIWDVATEQERTRLIGHTSPIRAIAVATDGSWLCSGSANGDVQMWDMATGQQRSLVVREPVGGVYALAVARDGRWFASGGADGIHIWDVVAGQQRGRRKDVPQGRAVLAITVMPDGDSFASGGADGVVRIWHIDADKELASLGRHPGEVLALASAPDGAWLASGGADGVVRIWDVSRRRERTRLAVTKSGAVHAVSIAPDGARLAAVSLDQTIRIWDIAAGKVCALMRIEGRARSCAWTLDGRAIVIGGTAGLYLFTFRSPRNQVP